VTVQTASQIVVDYEGALKSTRYLDWDLPTLLSIRDQLRKARVVLNQYGQSLQTCDEVLEKIIERAEAKKAEAKADEEARISEEQRLITEAIADRRHEENKRIAIAGIVVAAIVGLVAAWWNHNRPQLQNANTLQTKTPQEYNQPSSPTQLPTASPTVSATLLPLSTPLPTIIPTSTPKP
jgi:hypothetical protein